MTEHLSHKAAQKILVLLFFALQLGLIPAKAQENPAPETKGESASSQEGKSTLPLVAVSQKDETPTYSYEPIDPNFWDRFQKAMDPLVDESAFELAKIMHETNPSDSREANEGLLAMAIALKHDGYIHASTQLFGRIVTKYNGTSWGEAALYYLSEISRHHYADEIFIENLVVQNEFGPLHPRVASFVGFYKGIYNLKNHLKWSENQFSKIEEYSYWHKHKLYLSMLSEVARNQMEDAEKIMDFLMSEISSLPEKMQKKIFLQQARLHFEKGEFQKAKEIYLQLEDLPLRTKGRVMLEKAWSHYYLEEYAPALGVLKALDSPYFSSSLTPERLILKMIIYKQLCYYGAVTHTARAFYRAFRPAINHIRQRADLSRNRTLTSMALLHEYLQFPANYIHLLREEVGRFREAELHQVKALSEIARTYKERDFWLQKWIDSHIQPHLERVANELLNVETQVQFLEYDAKVDSLRITQNDPISRLYSSEKVDTLRFDKIFWPVINNEFWWDERDQYKVLLSSRCDQDSLLKSGFKGI